MIEGERARMKKTKLEEKLTDLLNSESREEDSNTPDFILAEYMIACLDAFEVANNKREVWYGVELGQKERETAVCRELEAEQKEKELESDR